MTVPLLTTASTVLCPHGGQAQLVASQTVAQVQGAPLLRLSDRPIIVGCPFNVSGAPSPCLSIQWLTGATQTAVHQVPVLLQTSLGLCLNAAQAPQGMAVVVQTQTVAMGV